MKKLLNHRKFTQIYCQIYEFLSIIIGNRKLKGWKIYKSSFLNATLRSNRNTYTLRKEEGAKSFSQFKHWSLIDFSFFSIIFTLNDIFYFCRCLNAGCRNSSDLDSSLLKTGTTKFFKIWWCLEQGKNFFALISYYFVEMFLYKLPDSSNWSFANWYLMEPSNINYLPKTSDLMTKFLKNDVKYNFPFVLMTVRDGRFSISIFYLILGENWNRIHLMTTVQSQNRCKIQENLIKKKIP